MVCGGGRARGGRGVGGPKVYTYDLDSCGLGTCMISCCAFGLSFTKHDSSHSPAQQAHTCYVIATPPQAESSCCLQTSTHHQQAAFMHLCQYGAARPRRNWVADTHFVVCWVHGAVGESDSLLEHVVCMSLLDRHARQDVCNTLWYSGDLGVVDSTATHVVVWPEVAFRYEGL